MERKTELATQYLSRKLFPRKDEPLRVLSKKPYGYCECKGYTQSCIHGLYSVSHDSWKAMQAAEVERHNDVPTEAGNTGGKYVVERIVSHKDDYEGSKSLKQ